jgi:para-nitrobenzyl esterase
MLAAALAALPMAAQAQAQAGPRVAVTGGTIEGVATGEALLFRGIPFAAPPLAERRWRAPAPVIPWQGIRPARARAPSCPQKDVGWNHGDTLLMAEDCLTLDVRTASLDGKRPVMVWIHGGSNRAGSAGDTVLSPITKAGVVLVAIQYRLGLLGFLAPRGAADEAGGKAGNYGLMDQVAALRWVQENIARFGGDPANVTIFGESAGSQDVSLLLAMPSAQGLFSKAIMQSGTPGFGLPFRSLGQAFEIADQAEALLDTNGSLAALRSLPVAELLGADGVLHDASLTGDDLLWLKITVDGAVLPESPRALLARAPPRPVIIGTNRVEFGTTAPDADVDAQLAFMFGGNAARAKALYRFDDPERPSHVRLGPALMELSTDRLFRCPAWRVSTLLAGLGWPVWRYEFDVGQNGSVTAHAAEIPYVMNERPLGSAPGVSMMGYWTRFAIAGDPNGKRQPDWPRFLPGESRHMIFDSVGATTGARLKEDICAMLDNL